MELVLILIAVVIGGVLMDSGPEGFWAGLGVIALILGVVFIVGGV